MQQQVRRFTDTHLRGGDRLVRYSAVYGAEAGLIPVARSKVYVDVDKRLKSPVSQAGYSRVRIPPSTPKFHGVEHERLSALSFKQVTVGSLPTYPAKVFRVRS